MPVDIETEVLQLWAAIRVVNGTIKNMLPDGEDSLTIETVGLRPGRHHQIAGLAQILELSQSFTLELAIKALYQLVNPHNSPKKTHDLLELFESLPDDIKAVAESDWRKAEGRSPMAQEQTLREFLGQYRRLFEESRYLFEKNRSRTFHSKDFETVLGIMVAELFKRSPNNIGLNNLLNIKREEQGHKGTRPLGL